MAIVSPSDRSETLIVACRTGCQTNDIGDRTLPSDGDSETVAITGAAGLVLLCCPECGGGLAESPPGGITCTSCDTEVATQDGIIDFVAGVSGAELDTIDCDAFYRVSQEAALNLYHVIRTSAGPLWPARRGMRSRSGAGPVSLPSR